MKRPVLVPRAEPDLGRRQAARDRLGPGRRLRPRLHRRRALPGDWWAARTPDGVVVGYGWLDATWGGDAEILLAVDAAAQQQGVGSFVLARLEDEAAARGLNYVYNTVRDTHPQRDDLHDWLAVRGYRGGTSDTTLRKRVGADRQRRRPRPAPAAGTRGDAVRPGRRGRARPGPRGVRRLRRRRRPPVLTDPLPTRRVCTPGPCLDPARLHAGTLLDPARLHAGTLPTRYTCVRAGSARRKPCVRAGSETGRAFGPGRQDRACVRAGSAGSGRAFGPGRQDLGVRSGRVGRVGRALGRVGRVGVRAWDRRRGPCGPTRPAPGGATGRAGRGTPPRRAVRASRGRAARGAGPGRGTGSAATPGPSRPVPRTPRVVPRHCGPRRSPGTPR